MAEKFYAEMLTRSERDLKNGRLEISLCAVNGECLTISLSREAVSALGSVLGDHGQKCATDATKIPADFAVGHGRHEPVVMLRFEDEPAYGLSAEQAIDLGEALIDEAETVTTKLKYPARQ